MNTQYQKVAVVTGASQGLGASIVDAYRKLGYAVVATSRTITPSGDPGILTVQGDITDPATAERVIAAGVARVRPDRHPGQQRGHLRRPSRSPTTRRTTTPPRSE